jgi:hypothetical protein
MENEERRGRGEGLRKTEGEEERGTNPGKIVGFVKPRETISESSCAIDTLIR